MSSITPQRNAPAHPPRDGHVGYPSLYDPAARREALVVALSEHVFSGASEAQISQIIRDCAGSPFNPVVAGGMAADALSDLAANFNLGPFTREALANPSAATREMLALTEMEGLLNVVQRMLNNDGVDAPRADAHAAPALMIAGATVLSAPRASAAPLPTPAAPPAVDEAAEWSATVALMLDDRSSAEAQAHFLLRDLARPGVRAQGVAQYAQGHADLAADFGVNAAKAGLVVDHVARLVGLHRAPESTPSAGHAPDGDAAFARQLQQQENLWAAMSPDATARAIFRTIMADAHLQIDDDSSDEDFLEAAQRAAQTAAVQAPAVRRALWSELKCARTGALLNDPYTLPSGTSIDRSALTAADRGAVRDYTMKAVVGAWNENHDKPEEILANALLDACTCPIGLDSLNEAVLASDGRAYNAGNIQAWMRTSSISPMTNEALRPTLTPHHAVRALVARLASEAPVPAAPPSVIIAEVVAPTPSAGQATPVAAALAYFDIPADGVEERFHAGFMRAAVNILEYERMVKNDRGLLAGLRAHRFAQRTVAAAAHLLVSARNTPAYPAAMRMYVETNRIMGKAEHADIYLQLLGREGPVTFFDASRQALVALRMKDVRRAVEAMDAMEATVPAEVSGEKPAQQAVLGDLMRRKGQPKIAEMMLRLSLSQVDSHITRRMHDKAMRALRSTGQQPYSDTDAGALQFAADIIALDPTA